MISALLVACVLAANPEAAPSSASPDVAAYKEARAKVGRDADAHVRLALWCESRGMVAERTKHLTIATLIDPANATARGLLGMVQYQGKWLSPDAVGERIQADPEKQARIREYLERRVKAADKPDDQMKLALWCDQNDLKDQATAHFYRAVQLDPGRELAWKHLGYKKEKGRWAKPEQAAAEKEMSELQSKANKHWKPILERLRHGLESKIPDDRARAEARLAEFKDPAAVPMIWGIFSQRDAKHQEVAVKLLGQIDAPTSSQALAMLTIVGRSADVKRHAVEVLKRRDPRDFVEVLIALIRKPIEYEVRRKPGVDSPGELFVKGTDQNSRRLYTPLSTPNYMSRPGDTYGYDANGLPVVSRFVGNFSRVMGTVSLGSDRMISDDEIRKLLPAFGFQIPNPTSFENALSKAGLPEGVMKNLTTSGPLAPIPIVGPQISPRISLERFYSESINIPVGQMMRDAEISAEVAQQRLNDDTDQIDAYNRPIRDLNRMARLALADSTGVDLGDDPDSWQRWSTDLMGLAVTATQSSSEIPATTEEVPLDYQPQAMPTLVDSPIRDVIVRSHSCFAAGTSVRTIDGPQPIETLLAGDRVLTQNTSTGRVGFSPVLVAYHNPPNETYKIRFDSQDKAVVATGIHRFWKIGEGWAMARDLKPGDTLRAIGGVAKVSSIEPDAKQPVFNLRVAEGESFFVGEIGILAHDNSLVQPSDKPFDRVTAPELASSNRK